MREINQPACELLLDLADKVAAAACRRLGADQVTASRFGKDVADMIADEWGGQSFYIPLNLADRRSDRDAKIRAEFNGANFMELARKYNLSDSYVRRIIKRGQARRSGRNGERQG